MEKVDKLSLFIWSDAIEKDGKDGKDGNDRNGQANELDGSRD
jgi:hypothetical protein